MAKKRTDENLISRWDWPPIEPGETAEHYCARVKSLSDNFYSPRQARLQLLMQRLDEKAKSPFRRGIASVDELSAEFCSKPKSLHRYLKEQILLLIDRHPEIFEGAPPLRRPGKLTTKPPGATKWDDEALMMLWFHVTHWKMKHPKANDSQALKELVKEKQNPPRPYVGRSWKTLLNELGPFKKSPHFGELTLALAQAWTKRAKSAQKK